VARLTLDNVTVEAAVALLADSPRGLLLCKDELSSWFSSFERYSQSSALSDWLSMNDAGPVTHDRKTGERQTVRVERASVSVCGGVQPGVLARCMTPEYLESGFLARFLFSLPDRRVGGWTEDEVHPDVIKDWEKLLDGLLALEMPNGKPLALGLHPEALPVWKAFCKEWKAVQQAASGPLASAYAKLKGYAARLGLLHHLIVEVSAGRDGKAPVSKESVEAGIALARWFAREARRVLALRVGEKTPREELIAWIRDEKGGKVSVRDLQRHRTCKAEDAEKALNGLVAAGLGEWVIVAPGPKGGPSRREFRLSGGSVR
jgi:hypothetical protein